MIKSMTGFGQVRRTVGSWQTSVEIRSWNHRFFECTTRLPAALSSYDEKIRDLIRAAVKRGKIAVSISFRGQDGSTQLVLDDKKIGLYVRTVRKLQKKHGFKEPLSINALLAVPGLLTASPKEELEESEWRLLVRVINDATQKLTAAKLKEGRALSLDLAKRISAIEKDLKSIEAIRSQVTAKLLERLKARVSSAAEAVQIDPKRLEQEVVMLADRSDITEELVRARHHVDSFRHSLESAEEVGKKLDFISQEIQREINTIGSKAQDVEIGDRVIRVKSELEKIREQIQNVE